ncbi:MAG: hypothetical protein C0595_13145, partial [Marinilabiliales bacterium]
MDNINTSSSKLSYEELLEQNTHLKNQIKEIQQRPKRTLDELEKSEELFLKSDQFLNHMGAMSKVGGWQLDLKTQKLQWTKEVYAIHEVDEDFQPTVEKGWGFYHLESRAILNKAYNESLANSSVYDLELKIITAKGNIKDVRAIGKVINSDEGIPDSVFGTFQDITEKKKSENELIKAKEEANSRLQQIRIIHANTPNVIWKWDFDEDGNFINVY